MNFVNLAGGGDGSSGTQEIMQKSLWRRGKRRSRHRAVGGGAGNGVSGDSVSCRHESP